jgi:hypothetical protein
MPPTPPTAFRISNFGFPIHTPIGREGGWELAHGSDLWLTAEMEGWMEVGHQPLADRRESRRPQGVSNSSFLIPNS